MALQWCDSLEDNGGPHEAQVSACTQGELCEVSRKNDSQGWMRRILHRKLQHLFRNINSDVTGVIYGNIDHGHFHFRIRSKTIHPLTFGRTNWMQV